MKSLIVAMERNNGIGFKNRLPWKLPPDLAMFKTLTLNSNVIMGRNTYESLPFTGGLPNRRNIIVTKNKNLFFYNNRDVYTNKNNIVFNSLDILNLLDEDVWVIGGKQVYEEVIKRRMIDSMYITKIHNDFNCDTYLNIDYDGFNMVRRTKNHKYDDILYHYEVWQRS